MHGGRATRPWDQHDPWVVLGTPTTPNPTTTTNTRAGKRAYDPATRGFLSTDPLAPILGTVWDGNPNSYARNNGAAEMFYDAMGGALLARFHGASELSSSPSWMTHSMAAYGGAHAGAIVESVNL
ncbi:hypothetical protein [Paenarthrobacter aurescens]|uniref:Uncharacterized protein n=1 Tax=Paenarthrobacter aurescens TaxID=43663 RepID=A0A4Y3NCP2_PAEAU|nr:hypothetical protein [Paenarthrobacter aurescens]GEB19472.1 hypothetical protein AAU01_22270 [Paenarthrobacter aurescens]